MDTEAEGRERGQAPASSDEHPEKRKEKKEASSQLLLGTWAFTFGLGGGKKFGPVASRVAPRPSDGLRLQPQNRPDASQTLLSSLPPMAENFRGG